MTSKNVHYNLNRSFIIEAATAVPPAEFEVKYDIANTRTIIDLFFC